MTYKWIVFDLDGTLLDTLDDLHGAVCQALRLCGYPCVSRTHVKRSVGDGVRSLIGRCLPSDVSQGEIERCLEAFREYYERHIADYSHPYEGVSQLLTNLRAEGKRIGVISNKDERAVETLCRRFFGAAVDCAAGRRDGYALKPSPDAWRNFEEKIGASAQECCYVGDSEADVRFARNVGVNFIAVSWGFRSRERLLGVGAREICDSAAELAKAIKRMERNS